MTHLLILCASLAAVVMFCARLGVIDRKSWRLATRHSGRHAAPRHRADPDNPDTWLVPS